MELNKNPHTIHEKTKISELSMVIFATIVGVVAGFGAVVFRFMIGFIHNLLFLGKIDFFYDANLHTPLSPWGIWVILVPVIGAVLVVWIVKNFAPEAKGHGVPEVMDAIYHKDAKIRPIVALVKSIASALSIGSGGSVGREGPIVQIGSAMGSFLGVIVKMPARQRCILIAAGAAGGIAATFNTPVGALAFGIELMLVSITAESMLPVVLSTVTATYIGRMFLGVTPSFYIPALTVPIFHLMPISTLVVFIPFGFLIGLCSIIFIRGLYWFEDLFEKMPGNYYTRHMLGMLMVGILIYSMYYFSGHYYVQGVGYAAIVDILQGALLNPWLLLILAAAKYFSTFLTLGSGASGGIFSPSLFLGAALGGAFGVFLKHLFPGLDVEPIFFALAGMAGMVGGATGAVLTGVIMVTEMTQNISAILPIMVTTATAFAVRKTLSDDSIYTLKLLRRGSVVPEGLQSAVMLAQRAKNVMNKNFCVATEEEITECGVNNHISGSKHIVTLVTKYDKVLGVLKTKADEQQKFKDANDLAAYLDTHYLIFSASAKLPEIMRVMKQYKASYGLVIAGTRYDNVNDIIGVVTEHEVFEVCMETANLLY